MNNWHVKAMTAETQSKIYTPTIKAQDSESKHQWDLGWLMRRGDVVCFSVDMTNFLQLWTRTNITMLHVHLTEDALLVALKDDSGPVLICDWSLFGAFQCKQCKMGICGRVSLPPSSIINTLIKVFWIFTKWLSLYFYMIKAMMCLHVIGLKWTCSLREQSHCTYYTYKWCSWKNNSPNFNMLDNYSWIYLFSLVKFCIHVHVFLYSFFVDLICFRIITSNTSCYAC